MDIKTNKLHSKEIETKLTASTGIIKCVIIDRAAKLVVKGTTNNLQLKFFVYLKGYRCKTTFLKFQTLTHTRILNIIVENMC